MPTATNMIDTDWREMRHCIALRSVDGKVNLDDSCIMRKLRHILSNG